MVELWDAYRADGTLAGVDLVRGEKIPAGLFHVVVEILVMHKDGTVLLMRRDRNKENAPGLWEASAGGSVIKGEEFEAAARRELLEETGIAAGDLEFIYKTMSKASIYYGYLCITDAEKDSITLQEGETIDYKWITLEEYVHIYDSDELTKGNQKRLRPFMEKNLLKKAL